MKRLLILTLLILFTLTGCDMAMRPQPMPSATPMPRMVTTPPKQIPAASDQPATVPDVQMTTDGLHPYMALQIGARGISVGEGSFNQKVEIVADGQVITNNESGLRSLHNRPLQSLTIRAYQMDEKVFDMTYDHALILDGGMGEALPAIPDAANIHHLWIVNGENVTDVSTVSKATSLQLLATQGGRLAYLDVLAGLTQLRHLDIRYTRVYNMNALMHLNLQSLRVNTLPDNKVRMDLFDHMGNLEYLSIGGYQAADYDFLASLQQLQWIHLGGCEQLSMETLQIILDNPRLKVLELGSCENIQALPENVGAPLEHLVLQNIRGLERLNISSMTQLKSLTVSDCSKIQSIDPVKNLPLEYLNLSSLESLENIDAIAQIDTLKQLVLIELHHVYDVAALNGHASIEHLEIFNLPADTTPLFNNTHLRTVHYFGGSKLDGLQSVVNLTSLHWVDIDSYNMSDKELDTASMDLSVLQGKTSLKNLFINTRRKVDISHLEGCSAVKSLHLWCGDLEPAGVHVLGQMNQLTSLTLRGRWGESYGLDDMEVLRNLGQLESLSIDVGDVTDYAPLNQLTSLRSLYLDRPQHRLSDALSGLDSLEELVINNWDFQDDDALMPLAQWNQLGKLVIGFKDEFRMDDEGSLNLSFIESMTSLQELSIFCIGVESTMPNLSELDQLHTLRMDAFQMDHDLTGLWTAPNVRSITLNRGELANLTGIESLSKLESLHIDHCIVDDYSALILMDHPIHLTIEEPRHYKESDVLQQIPGRVTIVRWLDEGEFSTVTEYHN